MLTKNVPGMSSPECRLANEDLAEFTSTNLASAQRMMNAATNAIGQLNALSNTTDTLRQQLNSSIGQLDAMVNPGMAVPASMATLLGLAASGGLFQAWAAGFEAAGATAWAGQRATAAALQTVSGGLHSVTSSFALWISAGLAGWEFGLYLGGASTTLSNMKTTLAAVDSLRNTIASDLNDLNAASNELAKTIQEAKQALQSLQIQRRSLREWIRKVDALIPEYVTWCQDAVDDPMRHEALELARLLGKM